ncbi:MAG TPA: hypothetical protein VF576_02885 [Rubricoccaceae bacterium]
MESSPSPDRNYAQLRDAQKIQKAQTAFDALENEPEVVEAMAPRKYTKDKKVAEGRALLQAVQDAVGGQTEETGDRLSATAGQRDLLGAAHDLYAALAGTARAVYREEREDRVALGLTGTHDMSYAGRIQRMRDFITEARKPERLARFEDESELGAAALDELEGALDTAEKGMSSQDRTASRSQHATGSREAAFAALTKWMLKMQGHARVVLRGKPQLLEMLGIPRR